MLFYKGTQLVRDQLIGCIDGVLADHRRAKAVTTHSGHQVPQVTSVAAARVFPVCRM
jgi:hypothetical protein